ncbi:hypothetical protein CAF53_16735 [Sphingobium sp. LB126]|nr:hypothetical protein CAF53_16735 [Sphingobium sp. LB126]
MKVLIVVAHPDQASLTHSFTSVAKQQLQRGDHEVQVTDLYAMRWKSEVDRDDLPGLPKTERLIVSAASDRGFHAGSLTEDVKADQVAQFGITLPLSELPAQFRLDRLGRILAGGIFRDRVSHDEGPSPFSVNHHNHEIRFHRFSGRNRTAKLREGWRHILFNPTRRCSAIIISACAITVATASSTGTSSTRRMPAEASNSFNTPSAGMTMSAPAAIARRAVARKASTTGPVRANALARSNSVTAGVRANRPAMRPSSRCCAT